MCIICNFTTPDEQFGGCGDRFLSAFSASRANMKRAADEMLICSKTAPTPEARKLYGRAHKKMVRIIRDWNRIEQEREVKLSAH